jgi:Tfp pilus assembly protein PilO
MTGRDRIVLIAIVVFVMLGAGWMLVVSPERKQAAALDSQVAAARTQLATANVSYASAQSAQAQYTAAYAAIVSLGKAVPPTQEVPSLLYQIAQVSHQKNVEFSSISSGSGTGSSASATAPPSAPTSFTQMPFTFAFSGTFLDLSRLFQQLDRFTVLSPSGNLQISGRLLTIQSVKLAPSTGASSGQASGQKASSRLAGTITATAYVLPAGQGLTAGATASAPSGAASQSPSTTASGSGASSSPTAPAVARVTP